MKAIGYIVFVGLVGALCWWALKNSEEGTTEIPVGDGGIITVPEDFADLPPKERVATVFASYMDSAGYVSEVKQCVTQEIEAVPASEFQRIEQLEGDELTEAQLGVGLGVSRKCVESGDNVLLEDATAQQVATAKAVEGRQLKSTLIVREGVGERLAGCVNRRLKSLPDAQFIEFANGTTEEKRRTFAGWGRECR